MNSGVRSSLHVFEYCKGGFVIGPELEDVPQMKSRLLEVTVGLQDLTQLWKLIVSCFSSTRI